MNARLQAIDTPSKTTAAQTVCLVGMPNSGKTTLMNAITGGNFKTANYAGVTVSLLRGRSKPEFGPVRNIVDLPGVHSSVNPSPEEELACRVIQGEHPKVTPDAFILVVDATQLERHLKFAGLVARQRKPMVIALTMMDLLSRRGQFVDAAKLAQAVGLPVVPVDARTGKGLPALISALDSAANQGAQASVLAELPDEPVASYTQIRSLVLRTGAVARAQIRWTR